MRAVLPKLAACTLALVVGGFATIAPAESEDTTTIQVVTTLVGGKNVFIPSTIVVAQGKPHILSIFNSTDTPHGFQIPDLGIEAILVEQRETPVKLPALEGQRIYRIVCHLHPAHRTATLAVLRLGDGSS